MVKTRTISRIGAVILAFMVAVAMLGFTSEHAYADSGETLSGDGFEFKLWDEGDDEYSLLVTKYTGTDTTVIFPTSIQYNGKSYTVTGIENNDESVIGSDVTQVIIPKNYEAITGQAFAGCANLETVLIGRSGDNEDEEEAFYVGNGAFEGCSANIVYSAPEAQDIDIVIVIGADNKLPAPTNLRWYTDHNIPTGAMWEKVSEEYKEEISGYEVCVKWEKDGEVDTYLALLVNGHNFDYFFNGHGPGTYSFSVKTKAKESSTYEDSDTVWSEPVQFSSIHLNIVTKDEDGTVLPETTDSGNGLLTSIIDGNEIKDGVEISRDKTLFYPNGSILKFSAEREAGYLHRGTEFDNEPADLTQEGKVSKFTLAGNVNITVTFQKNSDTVPVIIDFCKGHETLAANVAEYINDEGTYTAQADGAILTIQYSLAGFPGDLDSTLDDIISEALKDRGGFDNGEMWESHIGKKPMQEYADEDDFEKDNEALKKDDIEAGMKLVAQWSKKAVKGAFTVKAPVCGTNVETSSISQTNTPVVDEEKDNQFETVTDGHQANYTRWLTSYEPNRLYDSDYYFNGKIVGGTTYYAGLSVIPKWGYYILEDMPEITINGKAAKIYEDSFAALGEILFAGPVTAVHNWDAGKVTKEPTTKAAGVRTFTCKGCGKTKTESIPKLTVKEALEGGASAAAADTAITSMKNDKDPAGTVFSKLRLRSTKQTKNSVKIVWNKVSGAKKYVIYGNKCGIKNKMKKITTVTGSSKVFKKVAGKKVKKGTYYKFMVVALNKNKKVITTSKVCHVATKGGKVTNHKSVTVAKAVITKAKNLKVGKSLKLGAKAVKAVRKAIVRNHIPMRYESTNKKIATVTTKGVIKAKKKGTCYVYAYAQNCVFKKIKVVVK